MQSPSYFSGIVKILENPKQKVFNNKVISTQFRALIPQIRKNKPPKIILLIFWGTLASDVKNYYQINDYILIEGYISIKINKNTDSIVLNSKKVIITVLKVYPFLLKSHNTITKV
jgi:hypothetical protein